MTQPNVGSCSAVQVPIRPSRRRLKFNGKAPQAISTRRTPTAPSRGRGCFFPLLQASARHRPPAPARLHLYLLRRGEATHATLPSRTDQGDESRNPQFPSIEIRVPPRPRSPEPAAVMSATAMGEAAVEARLQALRQRLGKKQQFEEAVADLDAVVRDRYAGASPALRKSVRPTRPGDLTCLSATSAPAE